MEWNLQIIKNEYSEERVAVKSNLLILTLHSNLKYKSKTVIMHVDFPYKEVWGKEMAIQMKELAKSINLEPGFIWKFWTESEKEEMAGGVYMFD